MTSAPPPLSLPEARAFLQQYHAETRTPGAARRWQAAEAELTRSARLTLSPAELAFGARVAWRNSVRCVGRLPWAALEVRDLRGVSTPDEVFAHLLAHLRAAFHGGAIRPLISVFGPGVRLLSPQLIRYADDPGNCGLVRFLRVHGWQARGARFEVLPVAIEVQGRVHLFRLPPDAVQEVPITHPDCPRIADLGLRWHALPVISDMALNVAGQHLPCAFNGWYVQTEIAARNLADENRYDALPGVAAALGLDTRRERTLWRDRALVELNVAALHSFDQAGVRITDHHTVTRHFTRFEQQEARAGRGVRGRWSWLIPPVSPATTPVWHRQYDDREESPNFVRVQAAWEQGSPAGRCPAH